MIKLNSKIKFKKGFTLIELLVVISIIALLSSVVLSSLNKAQMKARDSQRIQSLQQINKALALYYDDNGNYPIHTDMWGILSTNTLKWNSLATDLNKYIKQLPVDPVNNRTFINYSGYVYMYISNAAGSNYDLITFLESNNNPLACSKNDWYSNVGLAPTIVAPYFDPNYWCTSTGSTALNNISNRNNIYDIAPQTK